jgi:hypothetical protein
MLTVGVDIHKKTLTICVLDESDKPVITKRIENTVEKVVEFFSPYRGDARVAIEPTLLRGSPRRSQTAGEGPSQGVTCPDLHVLEEPTAGSVDEKLDNLSLNRRVWQRGPRLCQHA